jgi:hypothetical protein
MASKRLKTVQPDVPTQLRSLRGTVSVDIAVDGAGNVMAAVPKSGPPELYTVSLNAVKQWRYQPTSIHASPVMVMTTVEFKYQ